MNVKEIICKELKMTEKQLDTNLGAHKALTYLTSDERWVNEEGEFIGDTAKECTELAKELANVNLP